MEQSRTLSHTPRRRRRAARSCFKCRERKIKCDRNNPCGACTAGRHTCVFKVFNDPIPMGIRHRTSPTPEPEDRSTASPTLEHIHLPTPQTLEGSGIVSTVQPGNAQEPTSADGDGPVLQNIQNRVQRLEALSSTPWDVNGRAGNNAGSRPSDPEGTQIVMHKAQVMRFPMGIAPEFRNIIATFVAITGKGAGFMGGNDKEPTFEDPETPALIGHVAEMFQNCRGIQRSIKSQQYSLPVNPTNFRLPKRIDADSMQVSYFVSFETTYRILHKYSFDLDFQLFWANPKAASTSLRLKNLLVIALGSSVDERDGPQFRNMAIQWTRHAQEWLSGPLNKDQMDISGIQIHCLTILARKVFSVGEDLVWMSTGELIHKAMQMGLHRDPKHLPPMSVFDAEIRRRLWATILELAVQSALDSGMPPRISWDEFDTKCPSNTSDEEINYRKTELKTHGNQTFTSSTIQRLLFKSLPVRLEILRLVNGLRTQVTYAKVMALSAEITKVCVAINDLVKQHQGWELKPFTRNLLDYLVRRFYFPLHLPFATIAQTNPMYYHSMKVCVDTAIAFTNVPSDQRFDYLRVVGQGFFKETFKGIVTATGLELLVQIEAQHRDGTLTANPQYVAQLKETLNGMLELSENRIRHGEVNVKNHMFISMMLAHADAIVDATLLEWKIAQGARASVEWCYEALRQRAEAANLPVMIDAPVDLTGPNSGRGDDGLELEFDFFCWAEDGLS